MDKNKLNLVCTNCKTEYYSAAPKFQREEPCLKCGGVLVEKNE